MGVVLMVCFHVDARGRRRGGRGGHSAAWYGSVPLLGPVPLKVGSAQNLGTQETMDAFSKARGSAVGIPYRVDKAYQLLINNDLPANFKTGCHLPVPPRTWLIGLCTCFYGSRG